MSVHTYTPGALHFINGSLGPGMCAGRGVNTPSLTLGKGVKLDMALCWMNTGKEREGKKVCQREEAAYIPEKVKDDGPEMSENRQLDTETG